MIRKALMTLMLAVQLLAFAGVVAAEDPYPCPECPGTGRLAR